jgi:hypothetical protein
MRTTTKRSLLIGGALAAGLLPCGPSAVNAATINERAIAGIRAGR